MDFTLRGEGRSIKHSEYFHLAKAARVKEASVMMMLENDRCSHGEFRILAALTRIILLQGRDLGFNTVLGFFSKLSSGTGGFARTKTGPKKKK